MKRKYSILIIGGARPNFMKIGPIVSALNSRREEAGELGIDLRVSIIHTGQHYDKNMSDVFFRDLEIPRPARYLEVGSGSHAIQTAAVMIAFEKVVLEEKPELVVVVGDVNSTFACALTAKKLGTKVAHVEAGLHSFDLAMPEEINRKLTDAISDLLFVTEVAGVDNLCTEGISKEKIHLVGNVMIDSLKRNLIRIEKGDFHISSVIGEFCKSNGKYAVLTLHRPSNVDNKENFKLIWEVVQEIAIDIPILFPIHPRTRTKIDLFGFEEGRVRIIDPLGYLEMLFAVRGATMVLTDSGGLQEETTVLGIPCITIRENTERPITIKKGTNYLAGTVPSTILSIARKILAGKAKKGTIPPYWDGRTADRIADILLRAAIEEAVTYQPEGPKNIK